MIDALAIAITHVLLIVAFRRLQQRDDLDQELDSGQVTGQRGFAATRNGN